MILDNLSSLQLLKSRAFTNLLIFSYAPLFIALKMLRYEVGVLRPYHTVMHMLNKTL